jgi:hypothetical protein
MLANCIIPLLLLLLLLLPNAAVDHMNMGSLRAELMMPQCLALGEDEDEDELEAEMAIMGQGPGIFTKRSPHLAGGVVRLSFVTWFST